MSDDITWSFSRIDFSCKYAWYRNYVLKEKGEENFFSQLGGTLHLLLEYLARGIITEEDVYAAFEDNFFEFSDFSFTEGFDYELSAMNKMRGYFKRKKYWSGEVIDVEKKLEFTLPSGEKFTGYIDLVLNNDGVDLVDHKSSTHFAEKDKKKKVHQQYLYAYGYHQETGVYPKRLIWDFFKSPDEPWIVEFNYDDMMNSVEWAEGKITLLRNMLKVTKELKPLGLWMPDLDYPKDDPIASPRAKNRNMFCLNLCNYRNDCIFTKGKGFDHDKFNLKNYE